MWNPVKAGWASLSEVEKEWTMLDVLEANIILADNAMRKQKELDDLKKSRLKVRR